MKIDLAVWTAVDGYDWQPGSVYSPDVLADYKDEIGPLVPSTLPLCGLFLKDGKAVFYRVQKAERMDSRGRGAIYCVLGTVPEDRAKDVDFGVVFNSPEMAEPQKPFPTVLDYKGQPASAHGALGRAGFGERQFTGAETFAQLGGWCNEAKGGRLRVRVTGTFVAPLFQVSYQPRVEKPRVPVERPASVPLSDYHARGTLPVQPPVTQPCLKKRARMPAKLHLVVFLAGAALGLILMGVIWYLVAHTR